MPFWASRSSCSERSSRAFARSSTACVRARARGELLLRPLAGLLGRHARAAHVPHQLVELPLPALEALGRHVAHPLIEADAPRDHQRAGLPGSAEHQAVARSEGLMVELGAGVLGPRVPVGELLQLADVGRDERRDAREEEPLQHRGPEGASLVRVGAAAELVEQDEALRGRVRERGAHAHEVRGEGREVLPDLLLVADVRADPVVQRHRRAVVRGTGSPGARHQREEAARLQREGLAARVRPRDEEHVEVHAEPQVDGDHLVQLSGLDLRDEQGMAGRAQEQTLARSVVAGLESAGARRRRPRSARSPGPPRALPPAAPLRRSRSAARAAHGRVRSGCARPRAARRRAPRRAGCRARRPPGAR